MPEKHDTDHNEEKLEQLLMGGLTLISEEQPGDTSIMATSQVDDTAYNQGSDLQARAVCQCNGSKLLRSQ